MNRDEEKRLSKVEDGISVLNTEVGNNTTQLETIITNHLPHLTVATSKNSGKLAVLIPLVIACLVAIGGIYALIIYLL